MRRAAILLIVTLVGPSIATAICELSCLHHTHQAATNRGPSLATDCHGHDSETERQSVDAAGGPCHDATSAIIAVVEAPTQLAADRAARELPALLPGPSQALVPIRSSRFKPPDILLITAQFRI